MLVIWESANQIFMSKQYFESVKIEIKVENEFDLKRGIWESESWQMMWLLCVKCCLAVMERSRMIEWVDNDDNDNNEDAYLICFWWQLCEVFIEQEHNVPFWWSLPSSMLIPEI